jgi:site-specific DNA-cytosine methylase
LEGFVLFSLLSHSSLHLTDCFASSDIPDTLRQGLNLPKVKRHCDDFYRRLWPEEISPPLLTQLDYKGSNGARLHYLDNRILSLAECLTLQGQASRFSFNLERCSHYTSPAGASLDTNLFPTLQKGEKLLKKHVCVFSASLVLPSELISLLSQRGGLQARR